MQEYQSNESGRVYHFEPNIYSVLKISTNETSQHHNRKMETHPTIKGSSAFMSNGTIKITHAKRCNFFRTKTHLINKI